VGHTADANNPRRWLRFQDLGQLCARERNHNP
jgi:hypothetical protein